MKPKILLRSSFLGWLRGVWTRAFAPERKPLKRRSYRSDICSKCDKVVAVTKSGRMWRHKCLGG